MMCLKGAQRGFLSERWLTLWCWLMAAWLGAFSSKGWAQIESVWWMPKNMTVGGEQQDFIFYGILWLTGLAFVGVATTMVYFAVRYRAVPGGRAIYHHGDTKLEIIWTVIPACIFASIGIYSYVVWKDLQGRPVPDDAVTLDIVAYQYRWSTRYAGLDGVLGEWSSNFRDMTPDNMHAVIGDGGQAGRDDFITDSEIVIPEKTPIHLILRSRDVIHSVYVPHFRLYQDVLPGSVIDWIWFETTGTRNLELACSQLCGAGHYRMKAKLRVVSREEYDNWMRERSEAALAHWQKMDQEAEPVSEMTGVAMAVEREGSTGFFEKDSALPQP